MVEPAETRRLQSMLQAAVQSVRWTYSLFWQLCPQQGILVWGDGYYNGAIKTRKTVQPIEVSTEAATHLRSQHLRELYDSLSGEASGQTPRPAAALSPEDLTETEWFYLMCVSFSFPPGVGMPGKSYVKRQHKWLTRANEVDNKIFSRSILAKSAGIQTVVCIPLLDGVVELGTTQRVREDIGLIQHVKTFFNTNRPPTTPPLSEQSTSNNPPASRFISPATAPTFPTLDDFQLTVNLGYDEEEDPMQLDTAIQFESPIDGSSNLNSDFDLRSPEHHWPSGNLQQGFPTYDELELEKEDTHYSQTVSTVLKTQSTRWSNSNYSSIAAVSSVTTTAFSRWPSSGHRLHSTARSQRALKYILLTLPLLQSESLGGHVLAERRRREKLSERFVALRNLVPFVTKTDKASILDDAMEYMKQLKKRVQELEETAAVEVEVSIIDRDALVEIECVVEKEGLLQRVMQLLGEMRLEVTTVQSSICNGVFIAELRAKVKEDGNSKKISIKEVKSSIYQIIHHFV